MGRKRRRPPPRPEEAGVDEREWEEWRSLRSELGARLGSRGETGRLDDEEPAPRRDRRGRR